MSERGRVLIADDQPEVRELLAEKLRARGKEAEVFHTGRELLDHLAAMAKGWSWPFSTSTSALPSPMAWRSSSG